MNENLTQNMFGTTVSRYEVNIKHGRHLLLR